MLLASALGVAACSDSNPMTPEPDLEIVVLSGNGQVALPGDPLPRAFEVRVREVGSTEPSSGIDVEWTVISGTGAVLVPSRSTTNESGIATASLTLGPALGDYEVEAGFEGLTGTPARFLASAILQPSLTSISAGPVAAGGTVTLDGDGFATGTLQSTVFFSGIRGSVVSATTTQITARVPACLPTRQVQVTVRTGTLESNALGLAVEANGAPTPLALGESLELTDATGLACVELSGRQGEEYLAVVSSSSQVAAARWPYVVTGLVGPPQEALSGAIPVSRVPRSPSAPPDARSRWEWQLRTWEEQLIRERRPGPTAAPTERAPARVPSLGERRDFQVLNAEREFTAVTAEVVYVGSHAVIYQDLQAPSPGLRQEDFASLAADFDDPIYPTDTEVFGAVSDLDGNERVAILFTPVVNTLTEPGDDGFFGGFFYGLDLLSDQPHSNVGEVFYLLTPDPDGQFGAPRTRELVMDVIPAILAHEFQHMIAFNQRILVLGGTTQEALWLSEAMAQMAEDVVANAFLDRGDVDKALQYNVGNWIRASRFLADPGGVSLIVTQGPGTIKERGGGWLFVRYVRDHAGSNSILGALTRTTRVGVANVTAVTGKSWDSQFPDFSGALYLDETGIPVEERFTFPDLDLRTVIETVKDPYPLEPLMFDASDFTVGDELWSSASDYLLIRPPDGGTVALSLFGDLGSASSEARMQLTLVRTR